jgi:hypothetical protein
MAIRIQREHSLPVVAVRLQQSPSPDRAGATATAQVDLLVNEKGVPVVHASQTWSLDDFGWTSTDWDPQLKVPADLVSWVRSWAGETLGAGRPLWLHLVKPYGTLGAVPWERDLVPGLERALLRVPDVLPPPSRSTSTFTVALVATAPAAEGGPPALSIGRPVAAALLRGLGDRLHLHVFTDAGTEGQVRDQLSAEGLPRFEVHTAPGRPGSRGSSRWGGTQDLPSHWLRWIRDDMLGVAVDAVHFLVHGNSLGTHGAILTPLEPTRDREVPVSVEAGELDAFLTQVGALVAGFSIIPLNWSDHGLRMFADELGANRAGPVLLHDPNLDGGFGSPLEALAECYRFLADPQPGTPPVSAGLQMYAQPRHVAQDVAAAVAIEPELPAPSPAVQAYFERDETPAWLGAAQRYLEQQEALLLRFQRESTLREPSQAEVAQYAGIESAVLKAREVIDRHAERLL